jgi:hypothetical protein
MYQSVWSHECPKEIVGITDINEMDVLAQYDLILQAQHGLLLTFGCNSNLHLVQLCELLRKHAKA